MFDTSDLSTTSPKKDLPWRKTRLGFLLIRADGPVAQAHQLADKRDLVDMCRPQDRLLAIRPVQFPDRPEVLLVDDLYAAREALAERGCRPFTPEGPGSTTVAALP